MSLLNKISVFGIISLLLILSIYMTTQQEGYRFRSVWKKLSRKFHGFKKGWNLYVDGEWVYTLGNNVLQPSTGIPGIFSDHLTIGSAAGNDIRVRGLKKTHVQLVATNSHGILVRSADGSRSIMDLAGNPMTRMVVPEGFSRIMKLAEKTVDFQWFDDTLAEGRGMNQGRR